MVSFSVVGQTHPLCIATKEIIPIVVAAAIFGSRLARLYFATCMAHQGLVHSTIKTYLSGVRQMQVAMGLGDPDLSQMPGYIRYSKGS